MSHPLRIAIADDHDIFRQGLKALLKARADMTVVAEAARVDDIDAMLSAAPCDLLLLDLQMDRSSLNVLETLAKQVKVVVLTMSEQAEDAQFAVRAGARAVVFKRFALESLLDAIQAVAAGNMWLPPPLQAALIGQLRNPTSGPLSRREREIARLVALGLHNAEVGERLGITEETVKKHMNTMFHKLGTRDRVELTLAAIRLGIVTSGEIKSGTARRS